MHRTRTARLAVGAITALVCLSACGAQNSSPAQQSIARGSATAQLDYTTGQIRFPLDAYRPTRAELVTASNAQTAEINTCVKAHGLPLDPFPLDDPAATSPNHLYGVWTEDFAKKYGYYPGEASKGQQTLSRHSLQLEKFTTAQKTQLSDCERTSSAKNTLMAMTDSLALPEELSGRASDAARQDADYKAAVKEWQSCMSGRGYKTGEDLQVQGVNTDDKQTQIRTAVVEVECKNQTKLVQRLADIQASYEATLIAENEAALKTHRDKLDAAVTEAKTRLASQKAAS